MSTSGRVHLTICRYQLEVMSSCRWSRVRSPGYVHVRMSVKSPVAASIGFIVSSRFHWRDTGYSLFYLCVRTEWTGLLQRYSCWSVEIQHAQNLAVRLIARFASYDHVISTSRPPLTNQCIGSLINFVSGGLRQPSRLAGLCPTHHSCRSIWAFVTRRVNSNLWTKH